MLHLSPHEDTTYSEDSIRIESTARIGRFLSQVKEIAKESYRGPSMDGSTVEVRMAKREVGERIVTTKESIIDTPHSYHPASILERDIRKLYKSGNRCRVTD